MTCLLCSLSTISAEQITWTGAYWFDNDWSSPGNWNLNRIPDTDDDVVIPSDEGNVVYDRSFDRIKSLYIFTGSSLLIKANTELQVFNGDSYGVVIQEDAAIRNSGYLGIDNAMDFSLLNSGAFYNSGSIYINSENATGFDNSGVLVNNENSNIQFLKTDRWAIINRETGLFINDGEARMLRNGTGGSFWCGGVLGNTEDGNVIFEEDNPGQLFVVSEGVHNEGNISFGPALGKSICIRIEANHKLINYTSGIIRIRGKSTTGIRIASNATLDNWGAVEYLNQSGSSTAFAVKGSATINNFADATIYSSQARIGIDMASNARINNHGQIEILNGNTNIVNSGDLINQESGELLLRGGRIGINNFLLGLCKNDGGRIEVQNHSFRSIRNVGTFLNESCAYLEVEDVVFNAGIFRNKGWMLNPEPGGSHLYNAAKIINSAVLNDPYNRFSQALHNEGIWIKSLGNMEANEGYLEALDIAYIGSYESSSWYLEASQNTLAGVYDIYSNTFYPNTNAVGADYLYAEFTNSKWD